MAEYTITEAIYKRLANDSELTNMLSDYNGAPAIFTSQIAPEDARYPYLVVPPPLSNTEQIVEDNKQKNGLSEQRDIKAWTDQELSTELLERIINRARELCHRKGDQFDFGARENIRVRASGPTEAPRQENEGQGLTFSLKITTQEERS